MKPRSHVQLWTVRRACCCCAAACAARRLLGLLVRFSLDNCRWNGRGPKRRRTARSVDLLSTPSLLRSASDALAVEQEAPA